MLEKELDNLSHTLIDIMAIVKANHHLIEKATEINARIEPRIERLKERIDRMTAENKPKEDVHKSDTGSWP